MIDTDLLGSLTRVLDLCAMRHDVLASNLANIDTPGYHTRDLDFRRALQQAEPSAAAPTHKVRGLTARPDGNNVSLERETLLLAQNQLLFSASVQVMKSEFRQLSSAINEGK